MAEAILVILLFLPFLLILWLGNFADRARAEEKPHQVLTGIAYGLLVLVYAGLIVGGLLIQVAGSLAQGPLPPEVAGVYEQQGVDPGQIAATLPSMGTALWLPSLLGIILLLPPVRRLASRLIPIDPERTVHAIALSFSALVLINLLVTLALGLGNLASLMEAGSTEGAVYDPTPSIWAQDIFWVFLAMVGVGWLSRRSLKETLARLGLVLPTLPQVAIGIGVGLGLVPIILGLEYLASLVGIGADVEVERLTEQLLGPLLESIPGILTLGLAAALGEEAIFRGALQPRFGLLFTALLFALLHSNYGITFSTAVVFLLGIVLGIVRIRFNTSTSMIVHAIYNMSLGLISYLGLMENM